WESIRLLALFGTYNQVKRDIERHRLIEDLFDKDIGSLFQEFQYVLTQVLGRDALCSDQIRLELACRCLIGKIDMPRHYTNYTKALEYDYNFLSQPQTDKCIMWTVTMKPFGRYIHKLVLVFAFVHITAQDLRDSRTTPGQLASSALAAINDGEHMKQASENETRLHLGVAYGQGKFAIDWN
ncbi:hypothetical protein H4R20_003942, partial [Coemansia guatemalensis]